MNKEKLNKVNFFAWLGILAIVILLTILVLAFLNSNDISLFARMYDTSKALLAFSVLGLVSLLLWVVMMFDTIKANQKQLVGLVMGTLAMTMTLAASAYYVDAFNNPLSHIGEDGKSIMNGLAATGLVLCLANAVGSVVGMKSK